MYAPSARPSGKSVANKRQGLLSDSDTTAKKVFIDTEIFCMSKHIDKNNNQSKVEGREGGREREKEMCACVYVAESKTC